MAWIGHTAVVYAGDFGLKNNKTISHIYHLLTSQQLRLKVKEIEIAALELKTVSTLTHSPPVLKSLYFSSNCLNIGNFCYSDARIYFYNYHI